MKVEGRQRRKNIVKSMAVMFTGHTVASYEQCKVIANGQTIAGLHLLGSSVMVNLVGQLRVGV